MKNNQKDFDCVEMMHKGAQKIYEDTKGMSRQQEVLYWKKKGGQYTWPVDEGANEIKSQRDHQPLNISRGHIVRS